MWTKLSNATPSPRGIVQPSVRSSSQEQAELKSCHSGLWSSRTVSSGDWWRVSMNTERNDVHALEKLYDTVAI